MNDPLLVSAAPLAALPAASAVPVLSPALCPLPLCAARVCLSVSVLYGVRTAVGRGSAACMRFDVEKRRACIERAVP